MQIKYSRGTLTPQDIVKHIILNDRGKDIIAELIKNKEVIKWAEQTGVSVTEFELQSFANIFRNTRGLQSAEKTMEFFSKHGISEDDFEEFCEANILTLKLKDQMGDNESIKQYFFSHRSDFDFARISIILVEKEDLAKEILMQVKEKEAEFHFLARRYSIDEKSRFSGGYIGFVSRKEMSLAISEKTFNAEPGACLGPFRTGFGFQIIFIEELVKAEINEKVKSTIKDIIFKEWIDKIIKDGIKIEATF